MDVLFDYSEDQDIDFCLYEVGDDDFSVVFEFFEVLLRFFNVANDFFEIVLMFRLLKVGRVMWFTDSMTFETHRFSVGACGFLKLNRIFRVDRLIYHRFFRIIKKIGP